MARETPVFWRLALPLCYIQMAILAANPLFSDIIFMCIFDIADLIFFFRQLVTG